MSKVKYRSFRKSEETLWRSSLPENEVEKLINCSNTPEGYYYIRGNKQGHYKDYIYIDNKWYLLNDQRKENGQWVYKCTEFEFFPSLPQKEWEILAKVPIKRLSKTWRRYLLAYKHWCILRQMQRGIRVSLLKIKNDNKRRYNSLV